MARIRGRTTFCCALVAVVLSAAAERASSFAPPAPAVRPRAPPRRRCRRRRTSRVATCASDQETAEAAEGEEGGTTEPSSPFVVALTREDGKNDKLREALSSDDRIKRLSASSGCAVDVRELPCIEHVRGPDAERLVPTLSSSAFDYVLITSPEAAKVMASAWIEAGKPDLGSVAAVGKATREKLDEFGIDVAFVPSKATAATLAKELPPSDAASAAGRATSALYPASARAKDTLQRGLEERGFAVSRLDTYDTVPASWSAEQTSSARSATVACFASPSAVKAWLKNTAGGAGTHGRALASCIGETSATACREHDWEEEDIFYPEKPGVDGWTTAVADALERLAGK